MAPPAPDLTGPGLRGFWESWGGRCSPRPRPASLVGSQNRQLRNSTERSKGGAGGGGGCLREAASKPVPPDPSALLKGESPGGLDPAAPGP